ncbi:MAG: hypothetical protein WA477_11380 [Candidatus Sulfotelmatobacter sp.]
MKPVRIQRKDAPGSRSGIWYRDFTLIIVGGFAIFFGVIFWMEGDSVRAPFDLKVAIGCFVLAGICVLLASNRVLVLACAVMVPAALAGFNAGFTGNRKALVFCLASLAAGLLILGWEHWLGHFGADPGVGKRKD